MSFERIHSNTVLSLFRGDTFPLLPLPCRFPSLPRKGGNPVVSRAAPSSIEFSRTEEEEEEEGGKEEEEDEEESREESCRNSLYSSTPFFFVTS